VRTAIQSTFAVLAVLLLIMLKPVVALFVTLNDSVAFPVTNTQ
jgi:hypothetical protein